MSGSAKLVADNFVRITGKVVSIADGDTITLLSPQKEQIKIRLEGIDAPEQSQEFGTKSKQALSALLAGKNVEATITGKDKYGRSLGWLTADGESVNRRMVADGWAWQYLQYNQDAEITALQSKAKTSKTGLWASSSAPMPPWEYRALGRTSSPSAAPAPSQTSEPTPRPSPTREASGAGKYWINSNGVRHNRSCRWYGNTKRGHYSNQAEGRGCGNCGG